MNRSTRRDLHPPLRPRKGSILKVLGVARISTDNQDERSLADQEALYRRWLDDHVDGPYELTMIASRGSGERVDREELVRLEEAIESHNFDLILAEDLGRIARRVHAVLICEACEDNETRLIALNDSIDTGEEDWRLHTFFASMRHESYNRDTAKRIRRSQRNRFMQGGVLRIPLFCYHKPTGAKHDSELQKIPEMIPIVEEIVRLLENGASYGEVAEWLNKQNVPMGLGTRAKRWTVYLVRETVFNPLLKGQRVRNRKMSVRINKTGRRRSLAAPAEELLTREVPHLAFIDPPRYDRLIEMLRKRNERYSVPKRTGYDPRKGRPKKRTTWPGQQVYCGVCGRMFVYGGHGQTKHLMCNGARGYDCWNGVTFDAELAASRMSAAIFDAISALPEFDETITAFFGEEAKKLCSDRGHRRQQAQQQLDRLDRELDNLVRALKESGASPTIMEAVKRAELDRKDASALLEDIDNERDAPMALPCAEELRSQAIKEFQRLAVDSQEFARYVAKIVPKITAHPVRLCDGGHIMLRAELELSLAVMVPPGCRTPSVSRHLTRQLVVDLFEMPQRAEFRTRVMALRASGMTEKLVAKQLGITTTAAQRAAVLDRTMRKLGTDDPYILVTSPPDDYTKLRRHLHSRYRFSPLPKDDAA